MDYKFSDKVSKLQASAIREILKFTADPEVISFAAGNPAPEAFPKERITRYPLSFSETILSSLSSTALPRVILHSVTI